MFRSATFDLLKGMAFDFRMRSLVVSAVFGLCCSAVALALEVTVYTGLCDASAAVPLGAEHFVVADDERNTLVMYRRGTPAPAGAVDVSGFLGTDADKESDLEGAATIGKRTYWISSHGRNSAGKRQGRRLRFFATEVQAGAVPLPVPVGKPYADLLRDLAGASHLGVYGFADAAEHAPESQGGLNIEGLAATPEGRLLIGFRNPLREGRAILVPLDNPDKVIRGKKAKFGVPIELDLGQRGIRSIEAFGSGYLIVAGPTADDGSFALYRWSGRGADAPARVAGVDFAGLHPEAMFVVPGTQNVQILSDDGGMAQNGARCKDAAKPAQSFRSVTLKP